MNLQDDKLVGGVSKCLVEVIPTIESPLLLTKMALPQVFFSSPEKKHYSAYLKIFFKVYHGKHVLRKQTICKQAARIHS